MADVINFQKKEREITNDTVKDMMTKLYHDRKINNILHELNMAADKIIQSYGMEFKGEGDRDFVKDQLHKSYLGLVLQNIRKKG